MHSGVVARNSNIINCPVHDHYYRKFSSDLPSSCYQLLKQLNNVEKLEKTLKQFFFSQQWTLAVAKNGKGHLQNWWQWHLEQIDRKYKFILIAPIATKYYTLGYFTYYILTYVKLYQCTVGFFGSKTDIFGVSAMSKFSIFWAIFW